MIKNQNEVSHYPEIQEFIEEQIKSNFIVAKKMRLMSFGELEN